MSKGSKLPKNAAARRKARFAQIDAMDEQMRAVVNDYGLNIVNAFLQHGVTKPRSIRHLVEIVLNDFSPTRGSYSCQGIRTMHDDSALAKEGGDGRSADA